jgi:LacI family transcriptional regulator
MPATQKQIAQSLGLTQGAVSLALKRDQRIPEATRRRVLAKARELGYRPHGGARAMASRRFQAVGFLYRPDMAWQPPYLTTHIIEELNQRKLATHIAAIPRDELQARSQSPQLLEQLSVDGLLIHFAAQIPPRMIDLIDSNGLPTVWLNTSDEINCVYPEEFSAARRLTRQMIQLGHRRIGYVGFENQPQRPGPEHHYSSVDRLHGYEAAMNEAGLTSRATFQRLRNEKWENWDQDRRLAFCMEYLSRPDRPTAVVTRHPDVAGPMLHAAARLGLDVPVDLSLATFSDEPQTLFGTPITTATLPMIELARQSVAMLARRIDQPHQTTPSIAVAYDAPYGNSISPPAAAPGHRPDQ